MEASQVDYKFEAYISYASQDLTFARNLALALQARKRNVYIWLDLPGDIRRDESRQGLELSAVSLFIVSPDSLESPYTRDELSQAIAVDKPILPILYRGVADVDLPPGLREIFYILFNESEPFENFVGAVDAAIDRLTATLRKNVET